MCACAPLPFSECVCVRGCGATQVRATDLLVPGGVYSFVLTATIGAVSSSTAVLVRVNQAPRGGYGVVSPVIGGEALVTPFEVSAEGWTDDATVRWCGGAGAPRRFTCSRLDVGVDVGAARGDDLWPPHRTVISTQPSPPRSPDRPLRRIYPFRFVLRTPRTELCSPSVAS
jgi:hypothetical protein